MARGRGENCNKLYWRPARATICDAVPARRHISATSDGQKLSRLPRQPLPENPNDRSQEADEPFFPLHSSWWSYSVFGGHFRPERRPSPGKRAGDRAVPANKDCLHPGRLQTGLCERRLRFDGRLHPSDHAGRAAAGEGHQAPSGGRRHNHRILQSDEPEFRAAKIHSLSTFRQGRMSRRRILPDCEQGPGRASSRGAAVMAAPRDAHARIWTGICAQ